jgi:hypothetical protein
LVVIRSLTTGAETGGVVVSIRGLLTGVNSLYVAVRRIKPDERRKVNRPSHEARRQAKLRCALAITVPSPTTGVTKAMSQLVRRIRPDDGHYYHVIMFTAGNIQASAQSPLTGMIQPSAIAVVSA